MKTILWLGVYLAVLIAEVTVLPQWLGVSAPALHFGVLAIGIASQDFLPGFLFAGLSGIARDALAPPSVAAHALFSLAVFFCMRLFLALSDWDEPMRRIGAVAIGILTAPPAWLIASAIAALVFGAASPAPGIADLWTTTALRETLFAAIWFLAFSWLAFRRGRHTRESELTPTR